jgi:hypothetical protein
MAFCVSLGDDTKCVQAKAAWDQLVAEALLGWEEHLPDGGQVQWVPCPLWLSKRKDLPSSLLVIHAALYLVSARKLRSRCILSAEEIKVRVTTLIQEESKGKGLWASLKPDDSLMALPGDAVLIITVQYFVSRWRVVVLEQHRAKNDAKIIYLVGITFQLSFKLIFAFGIKLSLLF